MKEFLIGIYDFLSKPVVMVITCIVFIAFCIPIIIRLFKVLKQTDFDLYEKDKLQCIAFGLSCAIDEYQDHYPDDELLCNEHYVKICVLHREICNMIGEDKEGRKLSCSKSLPV